MADCPLWGDGSKWGDGDLWCRLFGSLRYATELVDDSQFHRVSMRITVTNNKGFVIDRIAANVEHKHDLTYTHDAFADRSDLTRISIAIQFTGNTAFVINRICPYIQLKKHLPLG